MNLVLSFAFAGIAGLTSNCQYIDCHCKSKEQLLIKYLKLVSKMAYAHYEWTAMNGYKLIAAYTRISTPAHICAMPHY